MDRNLNDRLRSHAYPHLAVSIISVKVTDDRRTVQNWKFQNSSSPYAMDFHFEMQNDGSKISSTLSPWQAWLFLLGARLKIVSKSLFLLAYSVRYTDGKWWSTTINVASGLDQKHMKLYSLGSGNKPDDSKLPCTTRINLNGYQFF